MSELKPCPFCGGSALLRGFAVDEAMHWWVACENCGATSGELLAESTPDRDFAVESWNHRTHPQPVTPAGGEVDLVPDPMKIYPKAQEPFDPSFMWDGVDRVLSHAFACGTNGDPLDLIQARREIHAATHPPVADSALARHWIERYAAGVDEELQMDRVLDALGVASHD